MASQDISELVLKVTSDGISEATQKLKDMKTAAAGAEGGAKKLASATVDGSKQQTTAIEALLKRMEAQVALLGKNTSESNAYKAAMKGATDGQTAHAAALGASVDAFKASAKAANDTGKAVKLSAEESAQAAIQRKRDLSSMKSATIELSFAQDEAIRMNKKVDDSLKNVSRGHGSNAAAMRESMVLMHEMSQGQYKRFGGSLMVLANQLDLIPKLMDKIGAASKGMQFAVLGSVAVGALLGFAMYSGASETHKFNNALIITGNSAGVTAKGIEEMAHSISDSTGNGLANARNMIRSVATSGTVMAENMEVASNTLTNFARITGKSSDEVIKQFEGLKNGTYKFAQEYNKTTGAFSANTLQTMHDMELLGKTAESNQLFWLSLDGHLNTTQEKLSGLGTVMRQVSNAFKEGWHDIGRLMVSDTFGEQLDKAQAALNKAKQRKATDVFGGLFWDSKITKGEADIKRLTPLAAGETADEAKKAAETKARIEGGVAYDAILAVHKRIKDKSEKLSDVLLKIDVQVAKAKAGTDGANITDTMVQEMRDDAVEKYNKEHKVKGNDDRTAEREVELEIIRDSNMQKIHLADEEIRASKEMANKQHGNERAELIYRNAIRGEELAALKDNFVKEKALIDAYAEEGGHSKVELMRNKLRGQQLTTRYNNETTKVGTDGADDARGVTSREIAEQDRLEKAIEQTAKTEEERLTKELQAETLRLKGVEETKSAKAALQSQNEAAWASDLEHVVALEQSRIEEATALGLMNGTQRYNAELKVQAMQKEIGLHKEISKTVAAISAAEAKNEAGKRTTKNIDDALASAKRFEKGMVDVFGKVGKAIGGLGVAFLQTAKDNDTAQQRHTDAIKSGVSVKEADAQLDKDKFDNGINGYASMADSAKNFFNEGSRGYKTMEGVSKVFHAVQVAQNLIEMGQLAIKAVMTQAGGDPYTAWARMAAMGAVVAALGFAVGGGFSSSHGGKSAADVQKAQGTGSVFGDIGTKNEDGSTSYKDKSESISKSLDLLKSNSNVMLPVNQAMLMSLRNIEASMSGLTNLVARTPGLTEGTNMGVQTGTLSRSGGSAGLGAAGGAAAGAYYGATAGAILGPLGMAIGAVGGALIGAVVGKLASLWGNTKANIVDSGMQFGGRVGDLQKGNGFDQYASVDTTKSSWFGLKKNTTNSVETQGLNAEMSSQFGLIFTNLEATLKIAAGALGKNSADVGSAIENMVLTTSVVSLKGLSGDALQAALNGVISKAMDEISQQAYPAMDAFRQVGEGYAQTVIRVASGVEQAKGALEQLGIKAIDFNAITNKQGDVAIEMAKQSIAATEGLSGVNAMLQGMGGTLAEVTGAYKQMLDIRAQMNGVGLNGGKLNVNTVKGAGGISQLGTALATYQDKYFTDGQKSAIMLKNVNAEFAKLGLSLPKSKAELSAFIIKTGQVGTEVSDKLTGQLLSLAGAYSDLVDTNTTANKAATDTLVTSIDALKKFSETIKSFKDSLLLGDLSNLTPTEKYVEAKRQYESVVDKAMHGDATAQGNVTSAAQAFLEASRVVNASNADYTASLNEVLTNMDSLQTATGSQLTDAEKQLAVLTAQADGINALNTTALGIKLGIDNLAIALPPPQIVAQADNSALVAELAKSREEAAVSSAALQKQVDDLTAAVYDAQAKAASTIVNGTTDAIESSSWNRKFSMDTIER